MSPAKAPAPILLASDDRRLRVEFDWRGDRFAHRIFVDDVPIAESIDGDADDPWPPSPPLQQLSLEQINGAPVVLGVGSAGRSHWSISVELSLQSNAVKFDMACRCPAGIGFLGSTYRLLDPAAALDGFNGLSGVELEADSSVRDDHTEVGPSIQKLVACDSQPGQAGTRCWTYYATRKTTHSP